MKIQITNTPKSPDIDWINIAKIMKPGSRYDLQVGPRHQLDTYGEGNS